MRFLHTADWQLGMVRRSLDDEAQARFAAARLDAVARLGTLAAEQDCAFAVVAGDVFETNHVDRRTVGRALEALRAFACPVLLLPGNHDPLDAASVWRSPAFVDHRPDHVEVLDDARPRPVADGVEVVGAPWTSKRPLTDLAAEAVADLAPGPRRVLVAHGAVDRLSPDRDALGLIGLDALEEALADGRLAYVALGDRHSTTEVGDTGRVWYAGAPEPTAHREVDPGNALVVDLDDGAVSAHAVGRWRFVRHDVALGGDDDLAALEAHLDAEPAKAETVLQLRLEGTVSVTRWAAIAEALERAEALFAAVERPGRHEDVVVQPDEADLADVALSGYAATVRDELAALAAGSDAQARTAADALALLVRLAGRSA